MKLRPLVLACACLFCPAAAIGEDEYVEPIYWRNTSPFTLIHGLPRARPAAILPSGRQRFSVNVEAANSFTSKTTTSFDVQLDGETSLVSFDWSLGLGEGYEVGIEVPWVRHHTGYLDTLIDHYHDLSGLPEKDRGKFPKDQLNFVWQNDGVTLVSLQDEVSGIGDVRLYAGRRLHTAGDSRLSVRGELKLPTGDAADLTGSGAGDATLSLVHSRESALLDMPLTIQLGGGLLYLGKGELVPQFQNRVAVLGFSSFAVKLGTKWSVVGQMDAHSALYDIDHGVPGSWSIQGGVALRHGLGDRWMTEFVIYEDLRPGSATDFTLALRATFRMR